MLDAGPPDIPPAAALGLASAEQLHNISLSRFFPCVIAFSTATFAKITKPNDLPEPQKEEQSWRWN